MVHRIFWIRLPITRTERGGIPTGFQTGVVQYRTGRSRGCRSDYPSSACTHAARHVASKDGEKLYDNGLPVQFESNFGTCNRPDPRIRSIRTTVVRITNYRPSIRVVDQITRKGLILCGTPSKERILARSNTSSNYEHETSISS